MFFICLKVSKIQWMRSELSTLPIAQKSVIQRQCSDVQLFYYLTLFFHAYTAFLDLHLTCQKSTWSKLYIWWSCDITCSGNTSFQQLPLASSAFMTPIPGRECSGAAGRCDAFIISAIIFLQHLHTEYLYQDIFLGSFTILLHPVFMWCCPMLTWHNLIQRSKWDIVCETGHWVSPPTGWRAESLHRAADVRLR